MLYNNHEYPGFETSEDACNVEVLSRVGLIRYVAFFVIDLATRKVESAGVAPETDGLRMQQVARELIGDFGSSLRGTRVSLGP